MVGTFQEILDASPEIGVRMKSNYRPEGLSFVGSSEPKYSSTELNFGRPLRAWLVHCFAILRFKAFEPPEAGSRALQYRTAWRMRQVPKLFPLWRRYGRDCDEN